MGIVRRLSLVGLMIVGTALIMASPARATELITSYTTKVDLNRAGVAHISESIQYNFDGQKHGVYRDIPVVTQTPDEMYLVYTLALRSVLRDGITEPYKVSKQGTYQRIKIGDADRTITGSHTYDIVYDLSPVVRHDSAGDYISLNLIGTEWEVSMSKSTATVMLPVGLSIDQATCYVGSRGSRDRDCEVIVQGNTVSVQSRLLRPGEGVTLDVVVPAGSFEASAYLEPTKQLPTSAQDKAWAAAILVGVTAAIGAGLFVLIKYIRASMKKRAYRAEQTIVPQYESPDGLLPGEIGLLTDDTTSMIEVTATLIHLCTRGYMKIVYAEKKRWFQKQQTFTLVKLSSSKPLTGYEKTLYDGIFASATEVELGSLNPTVMSKLVDSVKKAILGNLQKKGYYAARQQFLSADNVTAEGYKAWAKVEGFKLYLSVAEKDRLAFHDAPQKTPDRFSQLLPFAIALGVDKAWAAQFDQIDITASTSWYEGNSSRMNAVLLTNALSSNFASAVTSSFSPPSSSGGSGGGFSGGGGGGGGGGSW